MAKVKSAINFLKTVFVYGNDGGDAIGELHIFEVVTNGVLESRSYCGKSRYDINPDTEETDKHILPLCKTCAEKWKADSRSPWANYMKSFAPVKSSRKKKEEKQP